ncbi:MAG: vitamin K epoxide reductase family protein [Bacteroidales bacterium]|nr:vitamin K epoxide reductase family protein [Bacteroidales bacterium]
MGTFKKTTGPVILILSAAGAILSLILTLHALSAIDLIGCSGGSACQSVTSSKWSFVGGIIPVSALSMGLYLVALLCGVYLLFQKDPLVEKTLVLTASAIMAGSLWFIYLQKFKVGAFCPYCMSAHSCGILLGIITLIAARKDPQRKKGYPSVPASAGLGLAVLFALFQLLTTPSYRVSEGSVSSPLPVPEITSSPSVGPENAPDKITLLYDYRCSHCRVIHSLLDGAVEHFGGKVAFILCPTPLSSECNPYIPAGEDRFKGSCTLAKLALGLWKKDPGKFRIFDEWLFSYEGDGGWYPRSEEEASAMAGRLSPGESLDEEWTREYLSAALELFARTTSEGRSGIPRLVYGNKWVIPEVDDLQGFINVVENLLSSGQE